MKPLLNYEMKKILMRPFTIIICLGCLGVLIFFMLFSAGQTTTYAWGPDLYGSAEAIPENELERARQDYGLTGADKGALVLTGLDAIRLDQENTKPFEGTWDNERLQQIAADYLAFKDNPDIYTDELDAWAMQMREWTLGEAMGSVEVEVYSNANPIYQMKPEVKYGQWQKWATIEYLMDEIVIDQDGNVASFEEAFPLVGEPAVYEYHAGPMMATQAQGMFVGLLALLMLTAGLSPIFSDEVASRTEPMLLAAKYGRDKLIQAKILSGLLFALGCLAVLTLVNVLLCGGMFSFSGYNMPVQLEVNNYSMPFAFTYLQYLLAMLGMQVLGLASVAALIMLLSAVIRSAIPTIFIGGISSLLILFIAGSGAGQVSLIMQTLPFGAAMPGPLLDSGLTDGWMEFAVPQWVLAIIISAAVLVVSIVIILRKYKKLSKV